MCIPVVADTVEETIRYDIATTEHNNRNDSNKNTMLFHVLNMTYLLAFLNINSITNNTINTSYTRTTANTTTTNTTATNTI